MTAKRVVVIAGPSGSGKNAVIEEIMKSRPNCARLVTATTRAMRPGEQEGVDYYYLSKEQFEAALKEGQIPEHRFVPELGTYYGTYLPDLEKKLTKPGLIIFAQVDIEGARLLKELYGATTFFIMPENLDQFRGRLLARDPEWSSKELSARMKITEEEIRVHAPQYDYHVVNADGRLKEAADEIVAILRKEGYTI